MYFYILIRDIMAGTKALPLFDHTDRLDQLAVSVLYVIQEMIFRSFPDMTFPCFLNNE